MTDVIRTIQHDFSVSSKIITVVETCGDTRREYVFSVCYEQSRKIVSGGSPTGSMRDKFTYELVYEQGNRLEKGKYQWVVKEVFRPYKVSSYLTKNSMEEVTDEIWDMATAELERMQKTMTKKELGEYEVKHRRGVFITSSGENEIRVVPIHTELSPDGSELVVNWGIEITVDDRWVPYIIMGGELFRMTKHEAMHAMRNIIKRSVKNVNGGVYGN